MACHPRTAELPNKHQVEGLRRRANCTPRPVDQRSHPPHDLDQSPLTDAGGDRPETIAALPLIVHARRKRGYRLATIAHLILDHPPRRP
jgi:hypothetical protein